MTLTGQILLGEIEFLDQGRAMADVILTRDAPYLTFDNDGLTRLMEANPRIGYRIVRHIARIEARRLRRTSTE